MINHWFQSFLLPFGICVVLPITVLFLLLKNKSDADKRRTNLFMKALELNKEANLEKLMEEWAQSGENKSKNQKEVVNSRLLKGVIGFFIGITLITIGVLYGISYVDFACEPTIMSLTAGGIAIAFGLGYLLVWNVSRKQL